MIVRTLEALELRTNLGSPHPEGAAARLKPALTLASRLLATASAIVVYGASRIKASRADPDVKDSQKKCVQI